MLSLIFLLNDTRLRENPHVLLLLTFTVGDLVLLQENKADFTSGVFLTRGHCS